MAVHELTARQMPVIDRRIKANAGDSLTIWGLFDCHVDSRECDLRRLKADIARIAADPNAYAVIGGDFNDMIFHGDPRYAPGDLIAELQERKDAADAVVAYNCKLLEPIKDKILVYMTGNHEDGFAKRHHTNVAYQTAQALGVPYGDYCCFHRMFVNEGARGLIFTGYLHHGSSGGAVTEGSIMHARRPAMFDFDWSMTGHIHGSNGGRKCRLKAKGSFGCGVIHDQEIAQVSAASYKRNYAGRGAGWSAQREHKPTVIGASRVIVEFYRPNGGSLRARCFALT